MHPCNVKRDFSESARFRVPILQVKFDAFDIQRRDILLPQEDVEFFLWVAVIASPSSVMCFFWPHESVSHRRDREMKRAVTVAVGACARLTWSVARQAGS